MSRCKTKPCGCKDTGLTTNPPCSQNTVDCPNPEQCAETFSGECIIYTGDTIVDPVTGIPIIQYGERFNEIAQMLILMITNPSCANNTALNVMTTAITTTTTIIKWNPVLLATSYIVEYKAASSLIWIPMPPIIVPGTTLQAIGGLLPNTDYQVRVQTICPSTTCYSLTILLRTKLI